MVRGAVAGALAPVVTGGGALLAVFLSLLFQPATTTNAISANTARPATHPQMPAAGSS